MKIKYVFLILAFIFSGNLFAFKSFEDHPDYNLLMENEKNSIGVYQSFAKAVVNITIEKKVILQSFWFAPVEKRSMETGAGSGFVWDKDGHIVTNSHVVHGGDVFWVTFHKNKKKYKAKLVGKEPAKDLAVLKLIEIPENLTPIKVGVSKNLLVGQKAIAIGNPLALDHTMTVGVISALDRKIPGFGGVTIQGVIQTDAAINQGNSGGPLLDSKGRLVGINTMIFSATGFNAGLGFAIPADTVKRIVPELIQHGKIVRPGLGVGIGENPYGKKGLMITHVNPAGGAHKAGLTGIVRDKWGRAYAGDIILEISGKEVSSYDEIYHALENNKVGDEVEVKYLRGDKIKKVKVKLMPISF